MKHKILAVDDEVANLTLLREVLQNEYDMVFAKNGADALKRASQKPDLIILDIMMPEMDGYEVCERLKADPATRDIPVIFLTAKITTQDETKGFDLGAVDYITKPLSPPILQRRVSQQIFIHNQNRILEATVKKRTQELEETRLEIIQRLGHAAEFKDNDTGFHVIRMSHYSMLLGRAMGLPEEECELILNASPMHDIGKIGIPDAVLLKKGKLDEQEWEIMKQHPRMGAEILGKDDSLLMRTAREIALTHHEKWDGSGYPAGLKGKQIPLFTRIVMIADVFDALTTERPYKKAWPIEDALRVLDEGAGSHFDPELVPVFKEILPDLLEIRKQYQDEHEHE